MVSISDLRKKYLGAMAATDEDMQIVKAVREFVDGEIMPHRQDLDGGWHRDEALAKKTFEKAHQGLVDIGVQRAAWPESLGGLGVSDVANEMIYEELSRGDAGIATHMGIINWVMLPAARAGRRDLIQEFVPRICDDKPHGCCMALTEPSGGTNTEDPTLHGRTIRTLVEPDGDEWVINGHKIWPSGASVADIAYCVVCTTDPDLGDDGVALIYVPPDAKGMSFSKPFEKMGMCYTDTNCEIFFESVRVPKKCPAPVKTAESFMILWVQEDSVPAILPWARHRPVLKSCLAGPKKGKSPVSRFAPDPFMRVFWVKWPRRSNRQGPIFSRFPQWSNRANRSNRANTVEPENRYYCQNVLPSSNTPVRLPSGSPTRQWN